LNPTRERPGVETLIKVKHWKEIKIGLNAPKCKDHNIFKPFFPYSNHDKE